jgi:hypothetical protein
MPDTPFQMTQEEFSQLNDKFRDLRHHINNTLAVIMALSELGQRNPAHLTKLAQTVLQRGPTMVLELNAFQQALTAKFNLPDAEPAEAQEQTQG